MAKSLVLAEKPSVARELARVLGCRRQGDGFIEGDKYVVTWALGHLVTLADPAAYDKRWERWDMQSLPMLPHAMKLEVIKQSSKQFRAVKAQLARADVSEVIIATDAGREGELVARWILQKAGCKKEARRLWISSQTDRAIKEGFAKLRPAKEFDDLFKSARARSEADWLVGLNVTRALTCKHNAQLSAGRVQTPTLALIVKREEEIKAFKPRSFWGIKVKFDGFEATWKGKDGSGRIFDEAKASKLLAAIKGGTARVVSVKRVSKQKPPPAAYDLTELQRDANKKYAYTAKETLNIMQSLYERYKLLTYPRTDSRYIPTDVVPSLPERLRAVAVDDYKDIALSLARKKPLRTKYLVNDAKVSDHHAIIPTEERPSLWDMPGMERNIYDLVVRRFLAVLLPPYEYDTIEITLDAAGETYVAKGNVIKELGWKAAAALIPLEEGEEDEEDNSSVKAPSEGQVLKVLDAKLTEGKTSPPSRYTEATLLGAMEHPAGQVKDRALGKILEQTSGLGTPATRADIIEKLFSSFYIERQGREIVPTSKGKQLVRLAPEPLRSAELTAKWEARLAAIAKGEEKDAAFVSDMRGFAAKLVNEVRASNAKYVHDNAVREKCPDCGGMLLMVKTKQGQMLVCADRECGYRRSVVKQTNARCPNCHKKLELRSSSGEDIFACVCGYREKMSAFKERTKKSGAGKADVRRYMAKQNSEDAGGSSAMAEQLAKWMEKRG